VVSTAEKRRTLGGMSPSSTGAIRQPDPYAETRGVLLRKRSEIVAKVEQLGAHDPAEVANLGFGKRIGDGTLYAVERMTDAYQARTIYATVAEIDEALARIDAETYGRCTLCAKPIPGERLEAVPWAALCVPCSAKPVRSNLVR
jgi:DnaK suppressor protein